VDLLFLKIKERETFGVGHMPNQEQLAEKTEIV